MSHPEPVRPAHIARMLSLNNAHACELSVLRAPDLVRLCTEAFHARQMDEGAAFLIAFDQDARYESPNFLWFRARYARFVYVNRIVVAPEARGRGYARALCGNLADAMRRARQERLVCEVNLVPPNPASMAFHAAAGFVRVGEDVLDGGGKRVAYLERSS